MIKSITSNTNLLVDFGGGIQSNEDIKIAFDSGAQQITGGSIAVKNKDLFLEWIEKYGSEKIILGSDTKDGMVAVSGWQESSTLGVFDLIDYYTKKGIKYTISTDVAKDGMLQGPSFGLYKEMQEKFPDLQIIASGGVSCYSDLVKLSEMNLFGVIVGKAFYEGKISLKELSEFG